jgi:selT/selW/selH-like putative selenoprotein
VRVSGTERVDVENEVAMKAGGTVPAVRIEYCVLCGFLGRAASLAENVLHDFAEQLPGGVTVAAGEEGSFEVFADGQQIFSMLDLARFPEPDEVENKIRALLNG